MMPIMTSIMMPAQPPSPGGLELHHVRCGGDDVRITPFEEAYIRDETQGLGPSKRLSPGIDKNHATINM